MHSCKCNVHIFFWHESIMISHKQWLQNILTHYIIFLCVYIRIYIVVVVVVKLFAVYRYYLKYFLFKVKFLY